MRFLLKQRMLSLTDSYEIFDERGHIVYSVRAKLLAVGHQIHVYDQRHNDVGSVHEKLISLLPAFNITIGGRHVGTVQKRISLLRPKYDIDYMGWRAEGDLFNRDYDVYEGRRCVVRVHKQFMRMTDTYAIDIDRPEDVLPALLLMIAIDAANCPENDREEKK